MTITRPHIRSFHDYVFSFPFQKIISCVLWSHFMKYLLLVINYIHTYIYIYIYNGPHNGSTKTSLWFSLKYVCCLFFFNFQTLINPNCVPGKGFLFFFFSVQIFRSSGKYKFDCDFIRNIPWLFAFYQNFMISIFLMEH